MLSGGVDSAVSAALLKKRGFRVAGIFMKNWSEDLGQGCPWIDDQRCARQVARHLGIAFYTFNFERVYKQKVIAPFLRGSAQGLTPNPDITCNEEIKFKVFIAKARALGFSHFATGHYARLRRGRGGVRLLAGRDSNKDQSYFLYTLGQNQLSRVLFPIGDYTKEEVRKMAKDLRESKHVNLIGPEDSFSYVSYERFWKEILVLPKGIKISKNYLPRPKK